MLKYTDLITVHRRSCKLRPEQVHESKLIQSHNLMRINTVKVRNSRHHVVDYLFIFVCVCVKWHWGTARSAGRNTCLTTHGLRHWTLVDTEELGHWVT